MYPQQPPHYPHPYAPPPPRRGLAPLTIVLIVIGVVFVLGAGSCLLLGGLVLLGASMEPVEAGKVMNGPTAPPTTTDTTPPPTVLGADEDPPSSADDESAPSRTGTTSTAAPTAGSGKWMCNGTGWVRVCGIANVCNNMMMSGMGVSTDRQQAYTMAKTACEGQLRARGGAGVCNVACTPNAH